MIRALSLCVLTALITVSQAQHSVTLEPSVITASPGLNVRLSCTLGGGLTVSANWVIFIQQKIGNKPTFILNYLTPSNNRRGDGVPARFVGSASGNVGYLDINGVHPEDDAVYYCATWTGSQYHSDDIWVVQYTGVAMDIRSLSSFVKQLSARVQKIQDTIDQKSMLEPRIPIPDLFFGDRTKFLSFKNN
ncbi:unnamed protein product, partial [Ranitomeya imitator]